MGENLLIGYGSFFLGTFLTVSVIVITLFFQRRKAIRINSAAAESLYRQIDAVTTENESLSKILAGKEQQLNEQFIGGLFVFKPTYAKDSE